MPEDAVFDCSEGMLTVVRRNLIAAGVARAFIRFSASSSRLRETTRHADLVQRGRLGQVLQSLMAASYRIERIGRFSCFLVSVLPSGQRRVSFSAW